MYIRYFNGSHIVLINKGKTDLDSNADLVFRDSIGQVLGAVRNHIKGVKKCSEK